MLSLTRRLGPVLGTAGILASFASAAIAAPKPWQVGSQEPASASMREILEFHDFVLVIITVITVFVLGLLVYVMVKFNEKANPVPTKTTHHAGLEVVWTVLPILILIIIGIPSLKLLYFTDRTADPEMTLKVIGNQWYWSYEYPAEELAFDSVMIPDEEIKEGQLRLLEVDNPVVLPVDTNVQILMTSNDVLHAWALPQLMSKVDTVPGRINESWIRIDREGTYYGQCSELCGVNHGYMPIVVKAVSKEAYQQWLKKAKKEFAHNDGEADPRLAHLTPADASGPSH